MKTRYSVGLSQYQRMTTAELRESFLVDGLFGKGEISLVYWETDRAVLGTAVPLESPLTLETSPELASEFFCERRELGVINIGEAGVIEVDGTRHELEKYDAVYVGRGSRNVIFSSKSAKSPARFFLTSYPAHATHPAAHAPAKAANQLKLGAPETANQRTIFQYIHEGGIKSCQLVMGLTRLEPGSVWNTMPPHTHLRRSEIYLYFDVQADAAVVHLMGPGDETRHLMMADGQAVLSPIWSIHSGCGTRSYGFIWAMGGENQRFADMDAIPAPQLR